MDNSYHLYLPIADISINLLLLISIGLVTGLLAGVFGIGGGIISMPILVAIGIPAQIAVATVTNQMTAASFSSYLAYARRNRVDYKLGCLILLGGILGSILGVILFYWLSHIGLADIFISASLAVILSIIGAISAKNAATIIYYKYKRLMLPKQNVPKWIQHITPLTMQFISAKNKISALFPIALGIISGLLVSFLGIGGSLIMLPIMLYIFGVSPLYVAGTIHFQMIYTTILSTIMHGVTSPSIDIVLSIALIIGTAFGAQLGAKLGAKLEQETFKIILATIIITLCIKVTTGLLIAPKNIYNTEILRQLNEYF